MGTSWGLLSNHGRVLMCVCREPTVRLRDIATMVDLTERAVFGIIDDLCDGEILVKTKVGRRNTYAINSTSVQANEVFALTELLHSHA